LRSNFAGQPCVIRKAQTAVDARDDLTLEQLLRLIEDCFEIYDLIAGHPPSADAGAGEFTASAWTEDGVFDRGAEFPRPTGRTTIAGEASNSEHHRAVEPGIARFRPVIRCPNHGSSPGFYVHRVSANRWKFDRTDRAGRSTAGPCASSTALSGHPIFYGARWSHRAAFGSRQPLFQFGDPQLEPFVIAERYRPNGDHHPADRGEQPAGILKQPSAPDQQRHQAANRLHRVPVPEHEWDICGI
jgi:hypothetical protein